MWIHPLQSSSLQSLELHLHSILKNLPHRLRLHDHPHPLLLHLHRRRNNLRRNPFPLVPSTQPIPRITNSVGSISTKSAATEPSHRVSSWAPSSSCSPSSP